MVDAFSADPCSQSWWIVGNDQNLSDMSSFNERESKYFGRETEPRLKITAEIKPDTWMEVLGVSLGVSLLILLIISVALAVWVFRSRRIIKRLTAEEENDFRKGRPAAHILEYVDADSLNGLKFVDDFEIPKQSIQFGKIVGKGFFGRVYRAKLDTLLDVAVKVPTSNCSKDAFKSMLAEVKVLCYLGNHENVLRFIGACTKNIAMGEIYIVTQFCNNGNLLDYLQKKKVSFRLEESSVSGGENISLNNHYDLYRFCFEIASGMKYMGEKKVVHGDLSARNILLDSILTCKIGDFGLSKTLCNYDEYMGKPNRPLPWRWMAPECMKTRTFTMKSDVWSFGVTAWEIFSFGDVPYQKEELSELFIERLERGMRLSRPRYMKQEIYDEVLKCWKVSMEERVEFVELVEYFSKLWNDEYSVTL